jgi:hypothetical protein
MVILTTSQADLEVRFFCTSKRRNNSKYFSINFLKSDFMNQQNAKIKTAANYDSAMETGDHFKNGANLKSQMSRGNNKISCFRNLIFSWLCLVMLFCTSCAKNIYVDYQRESANTGKVVLKPSNPVVANVTLNDNLIVDNKHVKSITINNVPKGEHTVRFSSGSNSYKEKLDETIPLKMETGKETTKLITVPPESTGSWVYSGLALVAVIVYLVIIL